VFNFNRQNEENLKARLQTLQDEGNDMRKKLERSRGDLKQRTVDVHMLQVRVAQLCGSELDGLTVSQLEELERMQSEALRRVSVAKVGDGVRGLIAAVRAAAAGVQRERGSHEGGS
jgi:heterodisulfide reductase subunit A-like polyferredoxin